jgi:hypothetical protein
MESYYRKICEIRKKNETKWEKVIWLFYFLFFFFAFFMFLVS